MSRTVSSALPARAACATVVLGLALASGAHAEHTEHAEHAEHQSERELAPRRAPSARHAGQPPVLALPSTPPQVASLRHARILLAELSPTPDALRLSNRASESFAFSARADQVLTGAELQLPLSRPPQVADLTSLEVTLNGELVASLSPSELDGGGTRRLTFDPSLLASTNLLLLRLRTAHDAEACGSVAPGSWGGLQKAALVLTSADLPMPDDLAVLPLPFFDAAFDRDQTLHFVLSSHSNAEQLGAANLVAGWFALQGKGRLSFEAHQDALPDENAIVLVADAASARALGLALPADESIAQSGLELRAHPARPDRKLFVVWGLGSGGLSRAASLLVRDGTSLGGPTTAAEGELQLPELVAHQVPRWVAPGDMVLGHLPEKPTLRAHGGHSETLRIPFRLAPDLFSWPNEHVELVLGFAQNFSAKTGPASLHVALNGVSIGVLPASRRGQTTLRIERELLRGFNELLLEISYRERAPRPGQSCNLEHDASAWAELSADSRLKVGQAAHFAMLPDLGLFLYDGFPFSQHGDLRESLVVLPSDPATSELASMFGAVAHLATVTGHPSTKLVVSLGQPDSRLLASRDVLLIAARGRHPWLEQYRAALPLVDTADGASAKYPEPSERLLRYLAGRFDDAELERTQQVLDGKPFAAALAVPSPWAAQRSLVILTASDESRMPHLPQLLGYASAEHTRNDLLLMTTAGRSLFQLSSAHGRGRLPWWLAARWWLSHYWLLLLPFLGGAAALWSVYAHHELSRRAAARLREADV